VNILNKQSWTADSGLDEGLTTFHCEKSDCYEMLCGASKLEKFFGMT
jgi:hypothetical protein